MVEDRFDPSDLIEAEFDGVDWPAVDLSKGRIPGSTFDEADLSGADCEQVTANGASFVDATLVGATFARGTAAGGDFEGADLSKADFERAGLDSARFVDSRAPDADFGDAWLRDATFEGADLRDADFQGAYLESATLRDADLRGASLRNASLPGADLSGADLSGADLTGATLRGATLAEASVGADALAGTADCTGASLPAEVSAPAGSWPERMDEPPMVDGVPVGEYVREVQIEAGRADRGEFDGLSDREIRECEADLGLSGFPAAYRSVLRYCGPDWPGLPDPSYRNPIRERHEAARECADGWDRLTFRYGDADVVISNHLSYSFAFLPGEHGPDPPVFTHMEQEGPWKGADSIATWVEAQVTT